MSLFFVFFQCDGDPRALHSFPTRRSSDLHDHGRVLAQEEQRELHRAVLGVEAAHELGLALGEVEGVAVGLGEDRHHEEEDRKSTRVNSSHSSTSYAVFCLKKKKKNTQLGS